MKRAKVLALILAGGEGGRLGALTKNRAKPVMPFGGAYRLIDFALSNCRHSEINDVWIIEQYELHSLNEHLANGRPWDLDRTYGGLQILPPNQKRGADEQDETGVAEGNADAIARHHSFIRNFDPDVLLVLSADHIYKLDFRDVIEQHLANQAEVTMVTTRVPPNESAARFGCVKVDDDGRITDFKYKPEQPDSDLITTEVFVYDTKKLLETLESLNKDGELKDFGHELIPQMVKRGAAFEFRFEDYWRDVGTIESYFNASMDLLKDGECLNLDDKKWAILTLAPQRAPAFIGSSAHIENSLIAAGCKIYGRVVNSVVSPGVVVAENAEIIESIILPEAVIEKNVKLNRAIVDGEVRVSLNTRGEKDEHTDILIFAQNDDETIAADAESTRIAKN